MSTDVSVIIPAYNAADTISDTLHSLLQQTFTNWEAIIVNDGSTDATAKVVSDFTKKDKRIHLLSQENRGLSGARNTGLKVARNNWLLFLDADDWILPQHLELLTLQIANDSSLDVVYCGWTYALPDGEYVFPHLPETFGDLFVSFSQGCTSIVHTFLFRRTLVDKFGPFDTSMASCEDWALWQRIARSGARFGIVNKVLAIYRTRPNSLSRNGYQLLKDGLKVLTCGHQADPNLPEQHPVYPNGLPDEGLTEQKLYLLCACAGYLIGGDKDARHLFDLLDEVRYPKLNPYYVADSLFVHGCVAASQPRSEWHLLWDSHRQAKLKDFLELLEKKSETLNLSINARKNFQILVAKYSKSNNFVQIINQKYAEFILLKRPIGYCIYRIKQLIKRHLLLGILLLPQVRHKVIQTSQFPPQEIADEIIIERAKCLAILNYTEVIPQAQINHPDQVSLEAFEEQLNYLKESGFYSIKVEDWRYAAIGKYPLRKRPIILLFEDCQQSFLEYAWPIIQAYEFSATLCIYGSEIGKAKAFNPLNKRELSLIGWSQIRKLQAQGIDFAAHAMHRQDLTKLSPQCAWYEIQRSRISLQNELAIPVQTFVYPYGKSNFLLEYLAGISGYDFAITGDTGLCTEKNFFLKLPQIKVQASDTLEDFIKKIHLSS